MVTKNKEESRMDTPADSDAIATASSAIADANGEPRVTTAFTVKDDLKKSLRQRGVSVYTWGDFKYAIERIFMVTDRTPIDSIEFGNAQNGAGRIVAWMVDGGIEVREVMR